ncbi:MAG TPA: hypothetical protein VGL65_06240 [Gemmatimonadales bacterium]|jgi:nucleoside-diphosphate-sugar epimerase
MSTGSRTRPTHIDRRDIDNIRRRVLTIKKARRELRWIPGTPLDGGLRQTHDWLIGGGVR